MNLNGVDYYKQQRILREYKSELKEVRKHSKSKREQFVEGRYHLDAANNIVKKHTSFGLSIIKKIEVLEDGKTNVDKQLEELVRVIFDLSYQTFHCTVEGFYKEVFDPEYILTHKDWLVFKTEKTNEIAVRREALFSAFAKGTISPDQTRELMDVYKIHLLPKEKKFVATAQQLMGLLQENESLRKLVYCFKIKHDPKPFEGESGILPGMVIYLLPGKEIAQEVVDILKVGLNKKHGSGKTPRFSRKVNALLSYANGDGDLKADAKEAKTFKLWFDKDGIHFNKKRVLEFGLTDRKLAI